MKRILFLVLVLILLESCTYKQNSFESEINSLKKEINEKDSQIYALKTTLKYLKNNQNKNVKENIIDEKELKDTLDISDNFFIYNHIAKIIKTSNSEFEPVLENFDQVKSEYGKGFFARVMTFYNGQILPLENGGLKTDLHVFIQSTELGEENKTFVISDFYNVDLKMLEKKNNSLVLTFEHGKFPRKTEQIIIESESVKFKKK